MVDGVINLVPAARVGHIGLYRDPKTLKPVEYYCKLPADVAESTVIVLEPMFATGGSLSATIDILENRYGCKDIRLVCLIAAKPGVDRVMNAHPNIKLYCAALDEKLNEHAYIVPGLGDAGDRIFGTK